MYEIKKLKDCATIIAGQSPESKYYNTDGVGMPFFQGKADFGELYPTVRVYCSQPTKIAEKDDILLSVRAPVGPTNLSPGQVCIGRGLAAIRPSSDVNLRYLLYYFRFFEAQLSKKGTGTTFKSITQATIKNLDVPVPSFPKQERIVVRIEELFSELDKAVETLRTTKQQLEVYRQAVLKEAFENIPMPTHKPLASLCKNIVDCPHSTPKWTSNGKLCLRTTNFRRGYLDLSEKNYVSEETFNTRILRLKPLPGDVLYSREGAILGLACIIPPELEICMGQRMMLLRPVDELDNRFLMHYLNSPKARELVVKSIGGTASPHINVGDIKNFHIPFVPKLKQIEVISEIESRLSVCDSIEQTVDATLQQTDALRQSILKEAFERRL